ncbi:MAG: rod shape-determining protein MreD [Nitrospinae bacterium]|nr:rod shape-determining protein MreD [Nitrospinota bacterium]
MVPALLLLLVIVNQMNAPFSQLPGRLEPDLALMVAVYGGLVYARGGAVALGFGAGLLQETLAGGLIGVEALSKGLTGLLWARLWSQVIGEGALAQLPLIAVLTAVDGAASFGMSKLFSAPSASWELFVPLLGWQLLSNLILGPLMLAFFAAMHRSLGRASRARRGGHEPTATF